MKNLTLLSDSLAGLTLSLDGKTNEIPTVQSLLKMIEISGMLVVADALNCQHKTAEIIVEKGADYLLSAKDNQPKLKQSIEIAINAIRTFKTLIDSKLKQFYVSINFTSTVDCFADTGVANCNSRKTQPPS
jgi:hypothetical protein